MKNIQKLVPAALVAVFAVAVTATPAKLDRPHSKVGFTAFTKLFDAVGKFKSFRVSGEVDHVNFENSKNIKISVDTSSVDTDSSARDEHLRNEDFFFVDKFPQATFVTSSIKKAKKEGKFDVTGTLTIRGVAKKITVPVSVTHMDGKDGTKTTRAKAKFRVNRQKFKLSYDGGLLMPTIKDNVDINFDLNFK